MLLMFLVICWQLEAITKYYCDKIGINAYVALIFPLQLLLLLLLQVNVNVEWANEISISIIHAMNEDDRVDFLCSINVWFSAALTLIFHLHANNATHTHMPQRVGCFQCASRIAHGLVDLLRTNWKTWNNNNKQFETNCMAKWSSHLLNVHFQWEMCNVHARSNVHPRQVTCLRECYLWSVALNSLLIYRSRFSIGFCSIETHLIF